MPWWEEAKANVQLPTIAADLGLSRTGKGWGTCVACSASRRGSSDRRGPMGFGRHGWRCFACGERGSALDLVSWGIIGRRWHPTQAEVEAWFAGRGLCQRRSYRPYMPLTRRQKRPDRAEVESLWAASSGWPREVVAYVSGRCDIDERQLGEHGVCRALPYDCDWPRWWPYAPGPWRLAVLGYEPDGQVATIQARAIDEKATPKTRWPRYRNARGVIFTGDRGRAMLRGEWKPSEVWICEGITDVISATQRAGSACVLGAAAGGFGAFAKVNWSPGVEVLVRTDNDEKGHIYAAKVESSLRALGITTRRSPWA